MTVTITRENESISRPLVPGGPPPEYMGLTLVATVRTEGCLSVVLYVGEEKAVVWGYNHDRGYHFDGDYFHCWEDGYLRLAYEAFLSRARKEMRLLR